MSNEVVVEVREKEEKIGIGKYLLPVALATAFIVLYKTREQE